MKDYIISDIHLGSHLCQANMLIDFLSSLKKFNRLIINGDLFDSHDFRRLNKHHWKILSIIRKLAKKHEVIVIQGNHDGPIELLSHLLGFQTYETFAFENGDKRCIALHGHIWDDFLDSHPIITWFGDSIYNFLQKVDNSHYLAVKIKQSSKQFLRVVNKINQSAEKFRINHYYDMVFLGHTHLLNDIGPIYNSGCWTEKPCSYLVVEHGEVKSGVIKS